MPVEDGSKHAESKECNPKCGVKQNPCTTNHSTNFYVCTNLNLNHSRSLIILATQFSSLCKAELLK